MTRPDRSWPRAARLPPTIARADVLAVVEGCRRAMPREPGVPVACDAGEVVDPRLPTIETIAWLALTAHRRRQDFRLEHAGPELLDLLAFCGLTVRVDAEDDAHPNDDRADAPGDAGR